MPKHLDHSSVWFAIDQLARRNRLSPSALARRAGLDPTTFNKSKRIGGNGKERWPSMESVAKVLKATGNSFDDFAGLISGRLLGRTNRPIPMLPLKSKDVLRFFGPAGERTGDEWEAVDLPVVTDPESLAVEVCDKRMEPVFSIGDILMVSPEATLRRGDRILVLTDDGYLTGYRYGKRLVESIDCTALADPGDTVRLAVGRVVWIAKIVTVWT